VSKESNVAASHHRQRRGWLFLFRARKWNEQRQQDILRQVMAVCEFDCVSGLLRWDGVSFTTMIDVVK